MALKFYAHVELVPADVGPMRPGRKAPYVSIFKQGYFMRNLLVKVFFVALVLGAGGAVIGGDQSVWYGQQTPTSTGLNRQNRWNRDALGTWPRDFQSPSRARARSAMGRSVAASTWENRDLMWASGAHDARGQKISALWRLSSRPERRCDRLPAPSRASYPTPRRQVGSRFSVGQRIACVGHGVSVAGLRG